MNAQQLFPLYEGHMQEVLYKFTTFWSYIGIESSKLSVFISFIGIFLNLVHLTVLTKKTMRSSSTNTIMIGLAVSDIGLMIVCISTYHGYIWHSKQDPRCRGPESYWGMIIVNIRRVMDGFFRRASSWMVISMATVQTFSIKNAENYRFKVLSTTKCGWVCVSLAFVVSSIVTSLHWFTHQIVIVKEGKPWRPAEYCEDFPKNYTAIVWNFELDRLTFAIYLGTNALTSKIVPCIAFPILTTLLISEYRKAMKQMKAAFKTDTSSYDKDGDRTTKLVIFTTVSFMTAELPQALCSIANSVKFSNYGFTFLADSFNEIFVFIGYLNIATFGIVSYSLSSKYRSTFREIFCCDSSQKLQKMNNISPTIS